MERGTPSVSPTASGTTVRTPSLARISCRSSCAGTASSKIRAILGAAYVWTDSLALPIGLHFLMNFSVNNIYVLTNVRRVAEVVQMLLRTTVTGPSQFVQVYELVNTGAWLCVGALTAGYVALRYGGAESRLTSAYLQRA